MKRHNRLKKHTLGLAAALLVTAGMSQIALAGDSVYVNTSSLRYRTSAQIKDNNIAGNLSYGQKLERVGTSGQWTMILLNGKKYYVSSAYVTSKKPTSAGAVQTTSQTAAGAQTSGGTAIALSSNYKYANYSKINSGTATLYRSTASNKKNKVVCVNAGHGTNGGGSVKTQCHPDGSAKVTGGTTGAGATSAVAVSSGMTFADGTAESKVTLAMAKVLKTKLLNAGYDVLMIRESDDVQLDKKNAIFTEILLQVRRSHQIDFLFRIILFQILNHHIPGCNDLISFNITPHFCQFVNICFRRFRRIIRKKYISLPCFLHFLQEIQRPVKHIRIQIKRPVHIEDKQFCLL